MTQGERSAPLRVGVQLQPQHTSVAVIRDAWRRAEDDGVDSIWLWDHLRPFIGDPDGRTLDAPTLLGVLAADTTRVQIGILVSPLSFRHPALLARSTALADDISGGRVTVGVGMGVFGPDDELVPELTAGAERPGARFGRRLGELVDELDRVRPVGSRRIPVLVGGQGPVTTLPLAARFADAWNGFGPPAEYRRSNARLDECCERAGRDPSSIERTVLLRRPDDPVDIDAFVTAGATHLIRSVRPPFDDAVDVTEVRRLIARCR